MARRARPHGGQPGRRPVTPPRCLVVGSYPPVPGPAAAATVAAVRRAWGAGREVVVASPRPSAAPLVLRAARAGGIAREVVRLGRGQRCELVVLCVEPQWPPLGGGGRDARRLAGALSGFAASEVVVTGEVGTGGAGSLWPLLAAAGSVVAASEEAAARLQGAGATVVSVCDPYQGAGVRPPTFSAGIVRPVEQGDLLLRARGRRLAGAMARRLLGRRAPAARAYLGAPWAPPAGPRRPVLEPGGSHPRPPSGASAPRCASPRR